MTEKLANVLKRAVMALLYIGIYLGLQYLLFIIVALNEGDIMNYSGVVTIIAALSAVVIIAAIGYVKGSSFDKTIKAKRISLLDVVLSFSMAVGFRMLTYVYFIWAENSIPVLEKSLENAKEMTYDTNTMTTLGMITILVSMYIIAPVFEELLFRGFVQKELSEAFGITIAVLLQGLLFGMAHGLLVQSVFAAVFGVLLGVIYHKTKNIKITMLSHLFFNMSSVLELKNGVVLTNLVVIGLLMTVISIIIFFYAYRKKHTFEENVSAGGNDNG